MEFEEHEEQEEEVPTANYEAVTDLGNSGRPKMGEAMTVGPPSPAGRKGVAYRYRECLKNHAVGIGGHAVDGCGEFMPAGDDGTLDALRCAACNCHRNFHRKEVAAHGGDPFPLHHHHHNQVPQFSPYYRGPHYLHVAPAPHHHPRPLALPSTSRDDEDLSPHPSSSGGGAAGSGGSKKRYRTKFTQEQKDKMLAFAESVEWRIQKQDEAAVQQFCSDAGVSRQVLKVWMHNNKHTLGKKP